MDDAVLLVRDGRPTVRLERSMPLERHDVWRKITDRDELRSWFPCDVEVDGGTWTVGASITFRFPPAVIDVTIAGTVLEAKSDKTLSYRWGDEVLTFELHDEDSGTRLVVCNELDPSHAARNAAGWETCLDRLCGSEPEAADSWRTRFEAYTAAFGPTLGPQEGQPEGYKGE